MTVLVKLMSSTQTIYDSYLNIQQQLNIFLFLDLIIWRAFGIKMKKNIIPLCYINKFTHPLHTVAGLHMSTMAQQHSNSVHVINWILYEIVGTYNNSKKGALKF
jgi:hypothetical protein